MFISQSHLPQILGPEFYTDERILGREVERLFLPGWHCVGALPDVPNDGDYFTTELFGRPLIVWRRGDEIHTFLNVCAHRASTLSDKPCGQMGERLKCQYHGWEYDETGSTRKIPDAKSFRPMEKGEASLKRFRTAACGELIYVTLDDDAPELREYLGPVYNYGEQWFSADHQMIMSEDVHHDCNWKVVVENFLEGYHLEAVHKKTFKTFSDERNCTHEFHDLWDLYTDDYSQDPKGRLERLACRFGRIDRELVWKHLLRYPNVIYGRTAVYSFAQTIVPMRRDHCRVITRIFSYPGRPGRLRRRLMGPLLRSVGRRFWRQVIAEDAAIFPSIQRGIASPEHPTGGLISIREERIFPFQQYILENTSGGDDGVSRSAPEPRTQGADAPRSPLHSHSEAG